MIAEVAPEIMAIDRLDGRADMLNGHEVAKAKDELANPVAISGLDEAACIEGIDRLAAAVENTAPKLLPGSPLGAIQKGQLRPDFAPERRRNNFVSGYCSGSRPSKRRILH